MKLDHLRHDWRPEAVTPRGRRVRYTCPHCTEETAEPEYHGGLCEVRVARAFGSIQAAATGAGTWAHTMEVERDWLAIVEVRDLEQQIDRLRGALEAIASDVPGRGEDPHVTAARLAAMAEAATR